MKKEKRLQTSSRPMVEQDLASTGCGETSRRKVSSRSGGEERRRCWRSDSDAHLFRIVLIGCHAAGTIREKERSGESGFDRVERKEGSGWG